MIPPAPTLLLSQAALAVKFGNYASAAGCRTDARRITRPGAEECEQGDCEAADREYTRLASPRKVLSSA